MSSGLFRSHHVGVYLQVYEHDAFETTRRQILTLVGGTLESFRPLEVVLVDGLASFNIPHRLVVPNSLFRVYGRCRPHRVSPSYTHFGHEKPNFAISTMRFIFPSFLIELSSYIALGRGTD